MPGDLVFKNPLNDGYVLINSSVVRCLQRNRQLGVRTLEAGGILLGLRRGRHLDVTMATTPKRTDKRARTSFQRFSTYHQRHAARAWRRLGKVVDYVGEWHTHPEPTPSPSGLDILEWAKLTKTRVNELLFLIVGTESFWIGVGLRGKLEPLGSTHTI
jgi:integrative and conjugative element protein (TIGR02256 family)